MSPASNKQSRNTESGKLTYRCLPSAVLPHSPHFTLLSYMRRLHAVQPATADELLLSSSGTGVSNKRNGMASASSSPERAAVPIQSSKVDELLRLMSASPSRRRRSPTSYSRDERDTTPSEAFTSRKVSFVLPPVSYESREEPRIYDAFDATVQKTSTGERIRGINVASWSL